MTSTSAFSDALAAYLPNLQSISPSLDTFSGALDTVFQIELYSWYETDGPVRHISNSSGRLTDPAEPDRARGGPAGARQCLDCLVNRFLLVFRRNGTQRSSHPNWWTVRLFSGVEPLPGLETYFAPLRSTYQLTYASGILSSGGHTLTAQANLDGATVSSAALTFSLDIQPPNPILVAPPDQSYARRRMSTRL